MHRTSFFDRFARRVAHFGGHASVFALAIVSILVWASVGPAFGFSDTWQLAMNTLTNIVTFLMVFIIQNTQNRDTTSMQLKLDELLRSSNEAQNALLDLEELSSEDLERLRDRYERLAREARDKLTEFLSEGTPEFGGQAAGGS